MMTKVKRPDVEESYKWAEFAAKTLGNDAPAVQTISKLGLYILRLEAALREYADEKNWFMDGTMWFPANQDYAASNQGKILAQRALGMEVKPNEPGSLDGGEG